MALHFPDMNTLFGIALDTWATIDRECDMATEVVAGQAQLTMGHRTGSLQLVLDEPGLTKLVEIASRALGDLRASAKA